MADRPIELPSLAPKCLRCGQKLTGATCITDHLNPRASVYEALEAIDGAVSVCAYCTAIGIFVVDRGDVKLRWPRADERLELAGHTRVQTAVRVFRGHWLINLLTEMYGSSIDTHGA